MTNLACPFLEICSSILQPIAFFSAQLKDLGEVAGRMPHLLMIAFISYALGRSELTHATSYLRYSLVHPSVLPFIHSIQSIHIHAIHFWTCPLANFFLFLFLIPPTISRPSEIKYSLKCGGDF